MDDVERARDARPLKRARREARRRRLRHRLLVAELPRRFPVDVLKVDRSFVDGLGTDPSDSAIVTAVVTLAHTLGLSRSPRASRPNSNGPTCTGSGVCTDRGT